MEDEMAKLSESMEKITEKNNVINDNLADRRGKLEKLSQMRRLLKKVCFCVLF